MLNLRSPEIGLFIWTLSLLVHLSGFAFAQKPNIVFFLSDDHRADVLGCAGHAIVKTPNIDALAKSGVRYSNAFVTTSICAASRATLLTGLFERTHGYTFGKPAISKRVIASSYPAKLKAAGYNTGFVGKFGVKVKGGKAALSAMFDSFAPTHRGKSVGKDGEVVHFTDKAGDLAIQFISKQNPGNPFCLSVSFQAAHAEDGDKENHFPYPDAEANLYEEVEIPRPKLDSKEHFESQPKFLKESMNRDRYYWRWDTEEKYDKNMRSYFRMITGLDRNIGRVMAELEKRGLSENTVIIFMGDNGYYMGERGFAGKWSHYDQSLRVPLVVYDPRNKGDEGIVQKELALNLDIAPTILQLAGVPQPGEYQGASLMNLANAFTRDGFFCEHRMENERIPKWEGYRGKRYVYANYFEQESQAEFLHDLKKDPDQLINMAQDPKHAPLLEEYRAKTLRLSQRYSSEVVFNPSPRPRVLMLGDSISMGYQRSVVAELGNDAYVIRPKENCAGTTKGIAKIDEWLQLDGGSFDIIHFNFGLHDLKAVTGAGGLKNSNNPNDPRQADLPTYKKQLEEIVMKLEASGATLIFATTTPFPEGVRPYRDPKDAERYNLAALGIMKEHKITVNDLYTFSLPILEEIQKPKNVHFSKGGSTLLGKEVARRIRDAIKAELQNPIRR